MDEPNQPGGVVKSDVTMIETIGVLHELGTAGVTEIADRLDMTKGAIHKHLKTLEANDWVVNDGGSYRLGFKVFTYGFKVRERNEMCNLLRSKVDELAEDTGQRVSASIEEHGRGTFVYIRNDWLDLKQTSSPGARYHLHESASGKAMLASMTDDRIEEIVTSHGLPRRTDNTISNREELFEALDRIRERNYALNVQEMREGMNAAAVSIYHPELDTLGALAIVGPSNQLTRETLEDEYVSELMGAVNEVELQMRYG